MINRTFKSRIIDLRGSTAGIRLSGNEHCITKQCFGLKLNAFCFYDPNLS